MEYLLSAQAAAGFEYLEQTGSTNKDLLARSQGLPEFFVLATDFQTAGKGRMDRSWEASPGSSVMASILLRPQFTQSSGIGWLSLLTALAITKAISGLGLAPKIKWPNDVLIAEKKVSGILAEVATDLSCVVIGFGINVNQSDQQLPVDTATSLSIESASAVERDQLLAAVIENIRTLYLELSKAGGDATDSGLRQAILEMSATVGSQVSVEFPDGKKVFGLAKDIDETGRLVVSTQTETLSVSAGDVLHLRKA
jgi:BirA family transcriptional regulator, biotin operon repressor / biotin---[acetyl-CoA-carboxylase] ligase